MDLMRRPAGGQVGAAPRPAAAALHQRATPAAHVIDLSKSSHAMAHEVPAGHIAATTHTPHHTPAAPPKSTVHERHLARFTDKIERAREHGRSEHITKFGQLDPHKMYDKLGHPTLQALLATSTATSAPAPHPAPEHHAVIAPAPAEMPHLTATQHAAMTQLARPEPAPAPAAGPSWNKPLPTNTGTGRVLTSVAVVAIMAGYIWLQNYPKLALQSANSRSGLSASLPGYLPSSYSLARTESDPGRVSLRFSSPSAPEALTINQQRTSWDSSSLLDNYVAKHADSYATFHEQGLTIYVFGNNEATWVNHGVWYSVAGAARLSREQLLKIVYSL
jgi:hypothetical protein